MRLEYRVLDARIFSTAGELAVELNKLGAEGWVIVSTTVHYITLCRARELVEPVAVPWAVVQED